MLANYEKLKEIVNSVASEIEKAEGGNKAAATRVRKIMQDIKKACQDVRKDMMGVKKTAKS